MKKWFLYIAATASLASCIYSFQPEIESSTQKILVVDGSILLGGESRIQLSYLSNLNQKDAVASAAGRAWIEDNAGNIYSPSSAGLTSVIKISTENAPRGRQYRTGIEVDGNTYYSEWLEANPAPTIENVYFDATDQNVNVYVDVNASQSVTGYLGFTFEETWEFHSDFFPEVLVNPEDWTYNQFFKDYPYYWCFRSNLSSQRVLLDYSALDGSRVSRYTVHSFSRKDSRNHKRYSILVKAFSLSKDAYMYNKQTQEMSEIGGDLFSPEPGTMPSNLSCENEPSRPVMGLVLAAEVTSKRAFLKDIYRIPSAPSTDILRLISFEEMPKYYYEWNYRPVMTITTDEGEGMGWGPHRCINCLEAGGTQEVPDFWNEE